MTTLTVQETLLIALGVVSGIVFYPIVFMFVAPIVQAAVQPWGKDRLPITRAVFALAAVFFLMFTFFGLPAIWVRFSMDATGGDWKSTYQLWGTGWFLGFCLFALIPAVERALRRRFAKKKSRVAG